MEVEVVVLRRSVEGQMSEGLRLNAESPLMKYGAGSSPSATQRPIDYHSFHSIIAKGSTVALNGLIPGVGSSNFNF